MQVDHSSKRDGVSDSLKVQPGASVSVHEEQKQSSEPEYMKLHAFDYSLASPFITVEKVGIGSFCPVQEISKVFL